MDADVIVAGAGLAGIVAAVEAADVGRTRVLLLDSEPPASLGGQAFWSFGGLFMVDTPEQRRLRIRDSIELAWSDWQGSAGFDRDSDHWPRRWAEAFVHFSAGELRSWLRPMGHRSFPVVGWAERRLRAEGHGNSVPRFHITWGTGPGVLEPFLARLDAHLATGRIQVRHRHRVRTLVTSGTAVVGVAGDVLEPSAARRGEASSRAVVAGFECSAPAVVVASGGIGGDLAKVTAAWPERLGRPPGTMVAGVPAHVDGELQTEAARAGASVVNADRMWHYTEGLHNWDPIWAGHGIRILPGPSSLWLDPDGERLPSPCYPGFDTLATLTHLRVAGHEYSWFVLDDETIAREFALSGSEQNPDLTGRSWPLVLQRLRPGPPAPVQAFLDHGVDFVRAATVAELAAGMRRVSGEQRIDAGRLQSVIAERDRAFTDPASADPQAAAVRAARRLPGEKLMRVAAPHALLSGTGGDLIAVRLTTLTRKTLGGIETDLSGRVLRPGGEVFDGLWAAGEVAGFGGGGMHGYNALEGTFLGGCLFSGRVAGRSAAGQ